MRRHDTHGRRTRSTAQKGARIAIRATEAKTRLLQDINLVNRTIGTLFIDDGKPAEPIPSGSELFERLHEIAVTKADFMSVAELDYPARRLGSRGQGRA